jgi:hypothetical protein
MADALCAAHTSSPRLIYSFFHFADYICDTECSHLRADVLEEGRPRGAAAPAEGRVAEEARVERGLGEGVEGGEAGGVEDRAQEDPSARVEEHRGADLARGEGARLEGREEATHRE